MAETRVIIVGGGVSGLATAYFLSRKGIPAVLIESTNRLGGLIQTDRIQGCLLEAGPDSYIAAKASVTELTEEIPSLRGQTIESNDAKRRIYIVRRGRLMEMPRGMSMMVPGDWGAALQTPLFSLWTKLEFAREIFLRPRTREQDVSIGEFVRDHFSRQLLDYVAEPLLMGVYGGDVASLSARSVLPRFVEYERVHGSLIRAVAKERRASPGGGLFLSLRGGMQSLTDALIGECGTSLRVVQARARRVEPAGNVWRVVTRDGDAITAENVVLACPAHNCAELIDDWNADLARELGAIPYSSVLLVTLVYDRERIQHPLDGFGFLVPKPERATIAATTWIHQKFPNRIRPDLAAIRAFIVGTRADELMSATETELLRLVRADLEKFLGISATPAFHTLYRWPKSMPQYVVGHEGRVGRIQGLVAEMRGLHLVGNAYSGVGIPDCVRMAKETAKAISEKNFTQ